MREFALGMNRSLDSVMRTHGASLAQVKLLAFIQRGDLVRSTDIGEAFGYAPRTVTVAIDGLERDGLVRREGIPNDRRVKRISLTDLGRDTLRNVEPPRVAFTERLFDVLDADEEYKLLQLLAKLNFRLQSMNASADTVDLSNKNEVD